MSPFVSDSIPLFLLQTIVCLVLTVRKCPQVCLPICDMTPGSCPCDHVCLPRPIELQQGDSTNIYLCGPQDAGESKVPLCLRICRHLPSPSGEAQAIELAMVVAQRAKPMMDRCNQSVRRHWELTQTAVCWLAALCSVLLRFKAVHFLPYLWVGTGRHCSGYFFVEHRRR